MVVGRIGILDLIVQEVKAKTGLQWMSILELARLSFDIGDDGVPGGRAKKDEPRVELFAKKLRRMNAGESIQKDDVERLANCFRIVPQDLYFEEPPLYGTDELRRMRRDREYRKKRNEDNPNRNRRNYLSLSEQITQQEFETRLAELNTRIECKADEELVSDSASVEAFKLFRTALLKLDCRHRGHTARLSASLSDLSLNKLEAWYSWYRFRIRLSKEEVSSLQTAPETDIVEFTVLSIVVTRKGKGPPAPVSDHSSVRTLRPTFGELHPEQFTSNS